MKEIFCVFLLTAGLYLIPSLGQDNSQCLVGMLTEQCTTALRILQEQFTEFLHSFHDQRAEIQAVKAELNNVKSELQSEREKRIELQYTQNVTSRVQEGLIAKSAQLDDDVGNLHDVAAHLNTSIGNLRSTVESNKRERIELQDVTSVLREVTTKLQADSSLLNQSSNELHKKCSELALEVGQLQNFTSDINVDSLLDEETFKLSIAPLQLQMAKLNVTCRRRCENGTACNPLAHLYGPQYLLQANQSKGDVVTNWYTGTGQWFSPILREGMTYSDGYITVPKQGVYYVYGQLFYNPSWIAFCGFRIEAGRTIVLFSSGSQIAEEELRGQYSGQMITLNEGETLVMKIDYDCRYFFSRSLTLFGAFLV